ncbi:hypothetical protein ACFQWH_09310 [Mycolicibacterium sp. GCM10028919]|uniref:hypothetical protein n=1 Tax=Mycolicibacterium sp. GCM10028919 TaxID=3273401 RepID=UPI003623DB2C
MSALVEFSAENHRRQDTDGYLTVPIPDLARRVISLYWPQVRPFEGRLLKQSTQSRSRILDAVFALESAAGPGFESLTIEQIAQTVPEVFRRAVDSVGVTLAQQPLPRLQRVPGASRSVKFLYDDSFLNDNVSRAVLQAHGNAIHLEPGVADSLTTARAPLHRTLKSMWVDDVLRLNGLAPDLRASVETHLFGSRQLANGLIPEGRASPRQTPSFNAPVSSIERTAPTPSARFADRLNYLFETYQPDGRALFSTQEVATQLRMRGLGITSTGLANLRLGLQDAPSPRITRALAAVFEVDPAFLTGHGVAKPRTTDVDQAEKEPGDSPLRSEEEPSERSTGGRHRAVPEEDYDSTATAGARIAAPPVAEDMGLFSGRLNALFALHTAQDGSVFTNEDVASSLQEDGLAVTETLIARLRAGSGGVPPARTIDALAFFFNVDIDYFANGLHANHVDRPPDLRDPDASQAMSEPYAAHENSSPKDVRLPAAEIAHVMSAVSQEARLHLEEDQVDVARARTLLRLINAIGAALATSDGGAITLAADLTQSLAPYRSPADATNPAAESAEHVQERPWLEPLSWWTRDQAGHPAKPGRWTLESFVAAVEHPADRSFLVALLNRFGQQPRVLGNHPPFWYGTRPAGGLFIYPFRLRYPPFQMLIDDDNRLTIRGNWTTFPKVAGHPGFAELAEILGQDEHGPAQGVRVEGLDLEELWDITEVTARAINLSSD